MPAAGCDGFRRASTSAAPPPPPDTSAGGLPRPRREDGIAAPLSFEPGSVHVTTAAIDSYRYHHGGSIPSARGELRDMLEAFAATAKVRSFGGYVSLLRDGYKLILNGEVDVLTGYSTVHRERTWAQLQAGVSSRFPGGGSSSSTGRLLKEPAELQPLQCDPATVAIHRRDLKSFAVSMDLQHLTAEALEAALRQFLAALGPDCLGAVRTDNTVEFTQGAVRVVLSADWLRVQKVTWPRRSDAPSEAAS